MFFWFCEHYHYFILFSYYYCCIMYLLPCYGEIKLIKTYLDTSVRRRASSTAISWSSAQSVSWQPNSCVVSSLLVLQRLSACSYCWLLRSRGGTPHSRCIAVSTPPTIHRHVACNTASANPARCCHTLRVESSARLSVCLSFRKLRTQQCFIRVLTKTVV